MNTPTSPADPAAQQAPPIRSRSEFESALRWAVQASITREARRIHLVDTDFAAWPLDDAELLASLTRWLHQPQRKLVLLARDYEGMPRTHPRFVGWRRDWSHAVEAWLLPQDVQLEMPTLFVDDGPVAVQLIDAVHWQGRASLDERTAHLWRETVDALLQRSEGGFSVYQLGL